MMLAQPLRYPGVVMLVPRLAAVVALCAACEPLPRVQLEVVVREELVQVFLRPLDVDCQCSTKLLLDGTCDETFTDGIFCDCGERGVEALRGCISDVTIEETGTAATDGGDGVLTAAIGAAATLVVTGCDAVTRVPLRGTAAPVLQGTSDFRRTGIGTADVAVSVTGASHAQVCQSGGLTEECCDGPPERVAVPSNTCAAFLGVSVVALAGPSEIDAPSGPIRVWSRARIDVGGPNLVPEPIDDTLWQIDFCGRSPIAPIVGQGFLVERIVFAPAEPERFTLAGEGFELVLAPDQDELRVTLDGNAYAATIPHGLVERVLPIGTLAPLELVVGPVDVVVANVSDAADTRPFVLDFAMQLPGIARP